MSEQAFLASRKQREVERRQGKREDDERNAPSGERNSESAQFWREYDGVKDEILHELKTGIHASSDSYTTATQRQKGREKLQQILQKVTSLEELIAQASSLHLLASADLKRASKDVQSLHRKIQDARNIISPQSKFVFSKYRQALEEKQSQVGVVGKEANDVPLLSTTVSTEGSLKQMMLHQARRVSGPSLVDETDEKEDTKKDERSKHGADPESFCTTTETTKIENLHNVVQFFHKVEGHTKTMSKDEGMAARTRSLTPVHLKLRDLDICAILIANENIGSMRMSRLSGCVIVCGSVDGPIYVENCKKSTFVLACHQLRIHSSSECSFIVTSSGGTVKVAWSPIIEDCHGLQFSNRGYSEVFSSVKRKMIDKGGGECGTGVSADEHEMLISSLPPATDPPNTFHVKDFKWHNVKQPSPNWSRIDNNDYLLEITNSVVSAFGQKKETKD